MSRSFPLASHARAVLLLALIVPFGAARAADQIGSACSTLGVSTMATDQKNLIVCLKNDRGALVWKSMTGSNVPVGAIIAWPVTNNPRDMQNADGSFNWLDCNGQSITSTLYPELFAVIGGTIPNLQGKFLRGLGGQSAALGVDQADTLNGQINVPTILFGIGTTTISTGGGGGVDATSFCRATTQWTSESAELSYEQCVSNNSSNNSSSSQTVLVPSGSYSTSTKLNTGSTETRPLNRSVRYLIRARS